MQFQFRAGDQGASTFVPPASSARPLIGDLRSAREDVGSEYRVTEELLAAHAIMRRDIEAQLRRELMIERESEILRVGAGLAFVQPIAILIQPLGLENGLNMMDRVLHRVPFPGFKDSEILASMGGVHRNSTVTKPLQNCSAPPVSLPVGIKRKTEAADGDQAPFPSKKEKTEREKKESADGDQAPSPNKMEKTENKWVCTLCQVRATCEKGLRDHFQGKKHKAKEAVLRKSAEKSQISEPDQFPEGDKGKSQLKEKRETSFWCPICETSANSRAIMETHRKGKKHLAKLRNKSGTRSLDDQEVSGMAATEEDVSSSNAESTEEIEAKEDTTEKGEKALAVNKKQRHLKFWCQTCKIGITSEVMMKEHQNGKKHMALLRKNGGALIVQTYGGATLTEEKKMNDPMANVECIKQQQIS